MSCPTDIILVDGADASTPISAIVSESISQDYSWALQVDIDGGTGGTGSFSAYGSNNNQDFDTLPNSENVAIDGTGPDSSQSLFDSFFPFRYLGFTYDPGTITDGTITVKLVLKK